MLGVAVLAIVLATPAPLAITVLGLIGFGILHKVLEIRYVAGWFAPVLSAVRAWSFRSCSHCSSRRPYCAAAERQVRLPLIGGMAELCPAGTTLCAELPGHGRFGPHRRHGFFLIEMI